jgi:3-hydroxyacyl-[acyl-carrier-protein] dehydratase
LTTNTERPAKLSAEFIFPEAAVWFQGHFPGQPTLPGVAQIQLVLDPLSRTAAGRCYLRRVGRVRFRRMIRPGESIRVEVESARDRPDGYQFRLTVGGEIACSGNLQVGWNPSGTPCTGAPGTS